MYYDCYIGSLFCSRRTMCKNLYQEYCTGCGLCGSIRGIEFICDEKGYNVPLLRDEDIELCSKICPSSGMASKEMNSNIWGHSVATYIGWSADNYVRETASSGGIITETCCYLLVNKIVDGIIQVKADTSMVYKTQTVISRTVDDVKMCMGSRYSISSPLQNIKELVKEGECYAFVGKPCDVQTLRMYLKYDEKLNSQIKYLFSFFCAGEPSEKAQLNLLDRLGCAKVDECLDLRYRGKGWPGYATAIKKDGSIKSITYNESWGTILGRDIRKSCRVCLDGIGEFADISCGDAWYLSKDNTPDFNERDGRNLIFARTDLGKKLLRDMIDANKIIIEKVPTQEEIRLMQMFQHERRGGMKAMLLAYRIMGRQIPKYESGVMKSFAKHISLTKKIRRMLGTIKRIHNGKI